MGSLRGGTTAARQLSRAKPTELASLYSFGLPVSHKGLTLIVRYDRL
ncbi:hypothetical protein HZB02_06755 [Candidatus Woesearchaeota archaeon]|nr:hypothetical protein [Candidatus Woesearchaeota archaeon]